VDELVALLVSHGVTVVFVATVAARLGAPVPAAPFLIVAGALTVSGQLSFAATVVAAVAGNMIGDAAWFLAGRRWGYSVMRLLCRISLSADTCVQRSESFLGRWGGASLIAAKFVPGVSVVAPPMAGALHMSNSRFLAYETLAALIWTLAFMFVGRMFHAAIADVLAVLANIGLAATAIIVLMLAAFLGWRYRLRRAALRADEIERIEVEVLRQALAAGVAMPTVIDVRGASARALDPRSIPSAVGMELRELPHGLGPLADGRELVLYCDCPDDATAIAAARVLMGAGVPRVRVLAGGLDAWVAAHEVAGAAVPALQPEEELRPVPAL
jgi:membrane protein DedA with SNARE-associated domain/rhodanese-related sulfurtransferase